MRVLVTWGSKRGGTAEIASTISDELKAVGVEVALMPASGVRELRGYDAAIIGGALYGNRWHRDARRLVTRHIAGLRRIPVCLFSSGPLDSSAATWRGGGISNLSLRGGRVVRASQGLAHRETVSMKNPPTGEPYAGKRPYGSEGGVGASRSLPLSAGA